MTSFPSWFFLLLAILSEVLGTTCMKLSAGFSKVFPSVMMFVFYGCSLAALTIAVKRIDISVAYALWSGLGTVLIATIGIFFFSEKIELIKVVSILFIVVGVVGLNLSSNLH